MIDISPEAPQTPMGANEASVGVKEPQQTVKVVPQLTPIREGDPTKRAFTFGSGPPMVYERAKQRVRELMAQLTPVRPACYIEGNLHDRWEGGDLTLMREEGVEEVLVAVWEGDDLLKSSRRVVVPSDAPLVMQEILKATEAERYTLEGDLRSGIDYYLLKWRGYWALIESVGRGYPDTILGTDAPEEALVDLRKRHPREFRMPAVRNPVNAPLSGDVCEACHRSSNGFGPCIDHILDGLLDD